MLPNRISQLPTIDAPILAPKTLEMLETADAKPPHEQYVADDHAITEGEHLQVQQQEPEELEPILTSLHLTGVDDLSTQQIKKYLDYHIKPNYSFNTRKQYAYLAYRLDWINDSEINIVFEYSTENEREKNNRRSNGRNNDVDLFEEIKGLKKDQGEMTGSTKIENAGMEETTTEQDAPEIKATDNALQDFENESARGAAEALLLLTDFEGIRKEHSDFSALAIEDQFKAVQQAPKLQDRKCWDLVLTKNGEIIKTRDARKFYDVFERVMQGKIEEEGPTKMSIEEEPEDQEVFPEDSKIIKLEVRYSTRLDKKVENARAFSRYYLLHGEPDKIERLPPARERSTGKYADNAYYENDLITAGEPATQGVFGYDGDREGREVSGPIIHDNDHRKRWKNDRFYDELNGGRERDSGYRVHKGRNSRSRQIGGGSRRGRRRGGRDHGRHQLSEDLFPGFAQRHQQ